MKEKPIEISFGRGDGKIVQKWEKMPFYCLHCGEKGIWGDGSVLICMECKWRFSVMIAQRIEGGDLSVAWKRIRDARDGL